MFTFDKAGNYTGRVDTSVAVAHAKIPPALIESGPFAGLPRAVDDFAQPELDAATIATTPRPDGTWLTAQAPVAPVPERVSARQMRLQLALQGISPATIAGMIASLPEPHRTLGEIEWEYASAFERNHALLNQLAGALNLTSEQVDDLFRAAEKL